jgi:N-acetylglucosamine kinase-like BadF-type ATPase
MTTQVVIGIDGGGTYTRAMVADTRGRVLAFVETAGSNPSHHPHAQENAQEAIRQSLLTAGCEPNQVASLVAGFAGLDGPEDHDWADRFTTVPGLTCPRLHVNDAVIAHAGALRSQPGIIAICGTGSIVFGVTPEGRQIRNYDFNHYAPTAARHLAYEAVFRIIAGEAGPADRDFVQQVLTFWEAADLAALRELGAGGFREDPQERNYQFGKMARLVTEAAGTGVPLAGAVCEQAATVLALGICLVGGCFPDETVLLALVGSAIRAPAMREALEGPLARKANRSYRLVEPALSSVHGAVLMALERCGTRIDEALARVLVETTTDVSHGRNGTADPRATGGIEEA